MKNNSGNLYFRTRVWEILTPEYVSLVADKFHFGEKDIPLIQAVARDIRGCIKDQEALEINMSEGYADVAITLGSYLDILMDKYSKEGRLLEQLAAENLISDILMEAYSRVNNLIESETDYQVAGFHFWGSEKNLPLEGMEGVISRLKKIKLSCTSDMCLRPSKSVLYRVDLQAKDSTFCTEKSPENAHLMRICDTCTHPCEWQKK